MYTFDDLNQLVNNGTYPTVEFLKSPWDESCAEKGMRGNIIRVYSDSDCHIVEFDLSKHEEHNKAFEVRDYYDSDGIPRLTAREAGCYTQIDSVYISKGTFDEELNEIVTFIDENPVYRMYLKDRVSGQSYVHFLENLVQELQTKSLVKV